LVVSKQNKDSNSHHLQVITCVCGYEIFILPNVKIMSQAIEKHVLEHKNKGATDSEVDKIEFELIAQLFEKIADKNF